MARGDDKIIAEAKARYERCMSWEGTARQNWLNDVKFANGDDINGYQWGDAFQGRVNEDRPTLTVNKTRAHLLMLVNDARQNKATIKFTPSGGGSTYEAAQILEGLARQIEYQSNASQAYDKGIWDQVQGGIGYWRVNTKYVDEDSMNQTASIDRIADALSVWIDPDIEHYDGSDAKFAFIENKRLTEDAERDYPVIREGRSKSVFDGTGQVWHGSDYTREVEYFRVTEVKDKLHVLPDGSLMREGDAEASEDALRGLLLQHREIDDKDNEIKAVEMLRSVSTRSREIKDTKVEWFKIVGDKIVERRDTVFDTIPIVRCVGEEFVIDGRLDRRGHVRAMRDPQRMYNYWTSMAAEQVALQPKAPFIGSAESIEGHEHLWEAANTESKAVLTHNAFDDQGRPLQPPARSTPPVMAQAFMAGLSQADQQMMMVTGQYPSELGRPGNETSGVAIQQRQRQGDTATYHYIDHQAAAIRYTGRLLLQALPRIMDTQRVLQVLAMDGKQSEVHVDPDLMQAHQVVPDPQPPEPTMQGQPKSDQDKAIDSVRTLWNPAIGKYSVEADVGPSFGTQRQEAFNAFTQIVSQNKELMQVAGDLLFKNADFPGADEMAERLRRMLPPQATGAGPSPAEAQLKQHLDMVMQQGGQMAKQADTEQADLKQKLDAAQAQLKARDTKADNDTYDAETRRLQAITAADPDVAKVLARSMLSELLGMPALPIIQAHQAEDVLHQQALQAGAPGAMGGPMAPPGMPTGMETADGQQPSQ